MATPRPRIAPPGSGIRGARGAATAASLAGGSALPLALEDLRDLPLARVEELVARLRPAPKLVDLEQLRRSRELGLVDQARVDGAVAVLRVDLLRRIRAQEVDERL